MGNQYLYNITVSVNVAIPKTLWEAFKLRVCGYRVHAEAISRLVNAGFKRAYAENVLEEERSAAIGKGMPLQ